jgi:hypothetical protein
MLIIFGFRTRPSKVSEGQFFCPRDGGNRPYVHSRYRQWFTLFFIPIFPTGKYKGEIVKCQACGTVYRPDVLSAAPVATTAASYPAPDQQPDSPASSGSTAQLPPYLDQAPAPAAQPWQYPAPPESTGQPQWPAPTQPGTSPSTPGNPWQQANNPRA